KRIAKDPMNRATARTHDFLFIVLMAKCTSPQCHWKRFHKDVFPPCTWQVFWCYLTALDFSRRWRLVALASRRRFSTMSRLKRIAGETPTPRVTVLLLS